jgi:hypothetical protein
MMTAPSTAPAMLPTPPASDVPPITAAAITLSSASVPIEFVPALSRAVVITAAIPQSTPIETNTPSVARFTSIPESAAASGFPPIANT